MNRTAFLTLALVSLFGLTACDTEVSEPAPAVPSERIAPNPAVIAPSESSTVPAIDDQIADLRENNGDIPQEERDRLNNVPAIPDVFDK